MKQTAQLKGSIFSSQVSALQRRATFDEVRTMVPPETQAAMDDPPLAISWIDTVHSRNVLNAIEERYGIDEVRRIGSEALKGGFLRLVRPTISGFLRVVGASPHSILGRLEQVLTVAVRGYTVKYRVRGPNEGEFELCTHGLEDSRAGLVGGWEVALTEVLNLAGIQGGTAHLQHFDYRNEDTTSVFRIRWD